MQVADYCLKENERNEWVGRRKGGRKGEKVKESEEKKERKGEKSEPEGLRERSP